MKKAIVIKSISIYFKDGGTTEPIEPDKETVATPEITCVDNVVTISCATEGAAISYTIDGGEAMDYAEPFAITKSCTIEATASKEGMNPATASAVCKFKRVGALEIDGVEYAEDAIEMLWNVVGVDGENAATAPLNKSLLSEGAAGTWTAVHEKCYAKTDGETAHLGSGKSTFKGGTITLSGSELPANAYITSVSISGYAASSATMTWGVSVNGIAASNTVVFDSAEEVTKTIDEVELLGNELVLTLNDATANKAFYLSGISVSYMVPAEAEAPVMLDVPTKVEHGTKVVWTVKYGKLLYRVDHAGAKGVMARGTDVTADWTEATENGGKQFTYEYASGANHNVYVKNVVNGKEAHGEAFNINETGGLTGIESVSAEGAEGVRELYNLQGVRVSEAEAAAGVYIERRGGKVAKVVIR
ncbi:MAG: chitobiase/beta-hexosaminidase C-terminal domain-containing protein [Alistipes timonensis]|nr:chitobiase/beta-hexosaminidase C-terminal domain-containing protein [Alistipes timonensis]